MHIYSKEEWLALTLPFVGALPSSPQVASTYELEAELLCISEVDVDDIDWVDACAGGNGQISTAKTGVGFPELSPCQSISGVRVEKHAFEFPEFTLLMRPTI